MIISKTELGSTGQQISCLGLGTMYFGTKMTQTVSFDIMDEYFRLGGNFLDSANKYASWIPSCKGGESEEIIGKWLNNRNNRNEMFLTSKVGFPYGSIPRSLKKEVIISECEKSLKRMEVETIDLYFAHTYDAKTPVEESMEAFFQLQKSGKIRFAGASNMYGWQLFESNQAAKTQGWEGFSCLQQRHSYLQPALDADFGTQLLITPEIIELCKVQNISLMAYSPLLGGAYTDANKTVSAFYESKSTDIKRSALHTVAQELNVTANAVVLALLLQNTPVILPIVATSSLAQFTENMQVLNIQLSKYHLDILNQSIEKPLTFS